MSVEFMNAYQEVLFDNLNAILKQNLTFQTQLKMFEKVASEKQELEQKCNSLTEELNVANSKTSELDYYKNQTRNQNEILDEKNRIQIALNDSSRKITQLEQEISEKQGMIDELYIKLGDLEKRKISEVKELKTYVDVLESNVPETKLKKIKTPKEVSNFTALKKVVDGSSF